MHLEVEQFNALVEQRMNDDQRDQLTDHLLECDQCRIRFKTLNELQQQHALSAKKRIPLRYVVGVAAVMIMAVFPYFSGESETSSILANGDFPDRSIILELPQHLGTLAQIEEVNFRNIASDWEGQQGVLQLIEHLHTLP